MEEKRAKRTFQGESIMRAEFRQVEPVHKGLMEVEDIMPGKLLSVWEENYYLCGKDPIMNIIDKLLTT